MADIAEIKNFDLLSFQQKLSLFETEVGEVETLLDDKELFTFLKSRILNVSENAYIRKIAVETLTNCVFLKRLKVRNELAILIDEWNGDDEVFLEIRRLKDLFLFYNVEPEDIENIYRQKIKEVDGEIVAESYYHLGLIEMQKAFFSQLESDCIENLTQSLSHFKKSDETIENRLDSQFFKVTVSLIIDLLQEKRGDIENKISILTNILFNRDILSISGDKGYFYISYYRTIVNLAKIQSEDVTKWLDFKSSFNNLFYYYSEIKNSEVENRLNQSVLSKRFSQYLEENLVQPFFAQNFPAEISRINTRLDEADLKSEQREFLLYIKKLALDADLKKNQIKSLS